MHRARPESLILLAAIFVGTFMPAGTSAYHAAVMFDAAPGAGGAGGLFYTGSPRERGWTCGACHVQGERAQVEVISSPPSLISERAYQPGANYEITVTLTDRLGLSAGASNVNTFALTVLDASVNPAGLLGGFGANLFYARGNNIIVSRPSAGRTSWSFTWTAPAAGTGPVFFYLGAVDGNGAGSGPQTGLTDPFGDGVGMLELRLAEI